MSDNPYAAPQYTGQPIEVDATEPDDRETLEEIIKDASHFWVAIPFCVCCAVIGLIIIPIWYTSRLLQCSRLQAKYPELLKRGEFNSLPRRFQRAKLKFVIGLFGAAIILLFYLAAILGI